MYKTIQISCTNNSNFMYKTIQSAFAQERTATRKVKLALINM